jgi:chromosomal replication initiation ATPase DnaA
MDALKQALLRAKLAKPLPHTIAPPAPGKSSDVPASEVTTINARFSELDQKLDSLLHLLKGPSGTREAAQHLLPTDIRRVVADFFGIAERQMDRKGRSGHIALARQIAYYLCRTHTARSSVEIGRVFGDRNHTTILHGVRRIEKLRKSDPALDGDLSKMEEQLAAVLMRRITG